MHEHKKVIQGLQTKDLYIIQRWIYICYLYIIYIYIIFRKYLQLQFPQKPIKHSSIRFKSTPLADSQMHYPLTFFFRLFLPMGSLSCLWKFKAPSNSTYSMDSAIRTGPSITTSIIIANIYQLRQGKPLTRIILFHPYKPPREVGMIVISIWQMRKVKPRKLNYLPKVPLLINHKSGIWPYGPLTSQMKFLTSTLYTSCLVVYIPLFPWLLPGVYKSVLIPSLSLDL